MRLDVKLLVMVLSTIMPIVGVRVASATAANDPTAPPPEWLALQPASVGKPTATAERPAEIQVIVIGRTKKLAVIDGQIARVGDNHKGSKVVGVLPGKVLLEDTEKSLMMAPAVEKRPPLVVYAPKKNVLVTSANESAKPAVGMKQ